MPARSDIRLALLGTGSDAGQALPGVARQMGFPVRAFHALGSADEAPEDDPDAEFDIELAPVESFDFSRVPVVLDLGATPHPARARALAAGARVIGRVPGPGTAGSGKRKGGTGSQLALAEIDRLPEGRHWHVPPPFAALVAPWLRAVAGQGRVERLALTALYPAVAYGQQGVEELAAQTVALLNAREAATTVLPGRLAFNAWPGARPDDDQALVRALAELLPDALDADGATATGAVVPWFHGHLLSVAAWCVEAPGDRPLAERLAAAAGTLRAGGFRWQDGMPASIPGAAKAARRGRRPALFTLVGAALDDLLPVLGGWQQAPADAPGTSRIACWLAADGLAAGVVAPMLRLARRAMDGP